MAIGFLTWLTTVTAQKPAIDLISSHQQYRHPEAIIDTCFAIDSLAQEPYFVKASPAQDQKYIEESPKKKRRQIGPSLDTILHKEEAMNKKHEKSKENISLFFGKFNPLKIFIYIIVLK